MLIIKYMFWNNIINIDVDIFYFIVEVWKVWKNLVFVVDIYCDVVMLRIMGKFIIC